MWIESNIFSFRSSSIQSLSLIGLINSDISYLNELLNLFFPEKHLLISLVELFEDETALSGYELNLISCFRRHLGDDASILQINLASYLV